MSPRHLGINGSTIQESLASALALLSIASSRDGEACCAGWRHGVVWEDGRGRFAKEKVNIGGDYM
jgi:hypothetical protein